LFRENERLVSREENATERGGGGLEGEITTDDVLKTQ